MTVQAMRTKLTREDIQRLANNSDVEGRATAARKLCSRIAVKGLDAEEKKAGEAILTILANDAAEMVRRSLATTLQKSRHLPRDVARKLAEDIDSIATPILSGSPVLTDEDLAEVIRQGNPSRQNAVAAREFISTKLVHEIVEQAAPSAVGIAAANDGAQFDDTAYTKTMDRFDDEPAILEKFIERTAMPAEFTEKLIAKISDQAMERLIHRHSLPPQLAVELAEGARERATVDLVEQAGLSQDPRRFVQQLQLNGRLAPSLILRTLFRGHMRFFEHAVAELAGIEHSKAWLLIHDAGPLGLEAVFQKTGLPIRVLPAIKAAVAAYHSLEMGPNGMADQIMFRKRLAERIFTQFQGAPEADLNYCIDRLDMDMAELPETMAA